MLKITTMLLFAILSTSALSETRLFCDFSKPEDVVRWQAGSGLDMMRPANGGMALVYRKFQPGGNRFPAFVTDLQPSENNWNGYPLLELDLQSDHGAGLSFVIELRNQDGYKHVVRFEPGTLRSAARQQVRLPLPPLKTGERIQQMHLYVFEPPKDVGMVVYRLSLYRESAAELLRGIQEKLGAIEGQMKEKLAIRARELQSKTAKAPTVPQELYDAIVSLAAEVNTRHVIAAGEKAALKFPETMRRPCTQPAPDAITDSNGNRMRLVWADEFNVPGLPDAGSWEYETGFVRNEELQYYTTARTENASVHDGCLVITGRREKWTNPNPVKNPDYNQIRSRKEADYTAASIYSRQGWTHGRIEVRAKLPYGRGLWPAIWMMGTNFPVDGWPRCGEIDILEYIGVEPNLARSGLFMKNGKADTPLHWNAYGQFPLELPEFIFHVYAMEWNSQEVRFIIDNQVKQTIKRSEAEHQSGSPWPFDLPLYLILNLAVGGNLGGIKGVDETVFPAAYQIDYVRVYQKP